MLTGPENEKMIPDTLKNSEPRKKLQNDRMLSAFWAELLENGSSLSNEEINTKLYNYRLGLDMAVPYLIVLFCVKYREGMSLRNEENLVQCIFRWKNTGFFRTSISISGIVVPMDRTMTVDIVIKQCEEYIQFLEDVWKYKLAVFVGTPLYMDKLTGHFNELMVMALGSVSAASKVYIYETAFSQSTSYVPPNLELWRLMLEKGTYGKLYGEIESYMNREMPVMRRHYLNRFMHDFEQMLSRFMSEMNIHLTLLMDDLEEMIYVNRYDSVENALSYIQNMFERIRHHTITGSDGISVSERVREYIANHLDQELTRETLAECVHMNADYLGKIFKKENGISLKEYVTREKLQMACELLGKTDLPVSEVALRVGYRNFAHFSTAFRRFSGVSPVAFRQAAVQDYKSKLD